MIYIMYGWNASGLFLVRSCFVEKNIQPTRSHRSCQTNRQNYDLFHAQFQPLDLSPPAHLTNHLLRDSGVSRANAASGRLFNLSKSTIEQISFYSKEVYMLSDTAELLSELTKCTMIGRSRKSLPRSTSLRQFNNPSLISATPTCSSLRRNFDITLRGFVGSSSSA